MVRDKEIVLQEVTKKAVTIEDLPHGMVRGRGTVLQSSPRPMRTQYEHALHSSFILRLTALCITWSDSQMKPESSSQHSKASTRVNRGYAMQSRYI